jgi:hypothetical protein
VRKARIGRNPNRPEKNVPIPKRAVVKFKAGKEMREAVLKLSPPPPKPAPAAKPSPAAKIPPVGKISPGGKV